jgi:hypothetical protein
MTYMGCERCPRKEHLCLLQRSSIVKRGVEADGSSRRIW